MCVRCVLCVLEVCYILLIYVSYIRAWRVLYVLVQYLQILEFGKTETKDLKENGGQLPVTEANKREYVQLACQMKMTESIKAQIKSFLEGFYEVIPKEFISIFNEQELELLISGLPTIDIDDLKANTEYRSYQETSLQVHLCNIKGAITQVPYTRFVIRNYLNTCSYYSNWKQLTIVSLCALFRVLVSIRKALGIDSTNGALLCVTRAVVSEREQETCCSPEPVCTRTTREIAPLILARLCVCES